MSRIQSNFPTSNFRYQAINTSFFLKYQVLFIAIKLAYKGFILTEDQGIVSKD